MGILIQSCNSHTSRVTETCRHSSLISFKRTISGSFTDEAVAITTVLQSDCDLHVFCKMK